jgi:uncharacterized protein
MIIRLHEIPKEGKTFHVDRVSGELNEALEDLIGERSYETEFQLLPVGQAFDLTGKVHTTLKETCSFCAKEFDLPVVEKFHELILKDDAKKLSGIKDFSPEDDISVSVVSDGLTYNIGELIHEIVALAEPFQPRCSEDCRGLCGGCGANLNDESCRCAKEKASDDEQNVTKSPFSVLKGLKLN